MTMMGTVAAFRPRNAGTALATLLLATAAMPAASAQPAATQPPPLRMSPDATGAVFVDGPIRAPSADAQALADILVSDALLLSAQAQAQARAGMVAAFDNQPAMQQFEAQHAGFRDALADALIPIAMDSMRRRAPGLRSQFAAFYDRAYSPAEIGRLRAFFTSPTGERFLAGMQRNFQPDALVAAQAPGRQTAPDPNAIVADLGAAGAATAAAMSPADQAVLMKLAEGGLLEKMGRNNVETARIMSAWSQDFSAEDQAALGAAVQRTMERYASERSPAK